MADKNRIQAIQSNLGTLKDLASQLDKTIVNREAQNALLLPASNAFSDIETILLPHGLKAPNPALASMWFEIAEFRLAQAEVQLKYAQGMVAKYGANLQAIGG